MLFLQDERGTWESSRPGEQGEEVVEVVVSELQSRCKETGL